MFDACFPFGPWVTSKLTFCPSFNDLNPGMLIAEKWANRSSPPPSGVIKPKPFASLNHLTVPVGMFSNPINQEKKSGRTRPMFRSQGQESTALRQRPTSRTGRALVLEIKHKDHYTRRRAIGQTHRRRTVSRAEWRWRGGKSAAQLAPNKRRTGAQRPELSSRDLP